MTSTLSECHKVHGRERSLARMAHVNIARRRPTLGADNYTIFEGTSEIQRIVISRALAKG